MDPTTPPSFPPPLHSSSASVSLPAAVPDSSQNRPAKRRAIILAERAPGSLELIWEGAADRMYMAQFSATHSGLVPDAGGRDSRRSKRAIGATPCRSCPSSRRGKMVGWGGTFREMVMTPCGFFWRQMFLEEAQRYGSSLITVRYGISMRVCNPQLICVRFVKADS